MSKECSASTAQRSSTSSCWNGARARSTERITPDVVSAAPRRVLVEPRPPVDAPVEVLGEDAKRRRVGGTAGPGDDVGDRRAVEGRGVEVGGEDGDRRAAKEARRTEIARLAGGRDERPGTTLGDGGVLTADDRRPTKRLGRRCEPVRIEGEHRTEAFACLGAHLVEVGLRRRREARTRVLAEDAGEDAERLSGTRGSDELERGLPGGDELHPARPARDAEGIADLFACQLLRSERRTGDRRLAFGRLDARDRRELGSRGEPVRSSRAASHGTEEETARDDPEREEDAEDRPVDGRVEGRADAELSADRAAPGLVRL